MYFSNIVIVLSHTCTRLEQASGTKPNSDSPIVYFLTQKNPQTPGIVFSSLTREGRSPWMKWTRCDVAWLEIHIPSCVDCFHLAQNVLLAGEVKFEGNKWPLDGVLALDYTLRSTFRSVSSATGETEHTSHYIRWLTRYEYFRIYNLFTYERGYTPQDVINISAFCSRVASCRACLNHFRSAWLYFDYVKWNNCWRESLSRVSFLIGNWWNSHLYIRVSRWRGCRTSEMVGCGPAATVHKRAYHTEYNYSWWFV